VAVGTKLEPIGSRDVYLTRDKTTAIPVYDAGAVRIGHRIQGPALIDTVDTTIWAPAGSSVTLVAGDSFLTTFGA
jgi:N-methylhydantoinase A